MLHGEQPVVVDTGLSTTDKDFVSDLSSVIDPADVRWVWITHPDRDHTGGLWELLEAAPNARSGHDLHRRRDHVVPSGPCRSIGSTSSIRASRSTSATAHCMRFARPYSTIPATTGFIDSRSGAMFSSDCFGAPMASLDLAMGGDVRVAGDGTRRAIPLGRRSIVRGCTLSTRQSSRRLLTPLRALDPSAVFSTHLPPAVAGTDALFDVVAAAPTTPGFIGPDQRALEELLASFEPAAQAG